MRWEYMLIQLSIPTKPAGSEDFYGMSDYLGKVSGHLNEYGKHGWELCHVTHIGSIYYFKRPAGAGPIPEPEPAAADVAGSWPA